VPLNPSQIVDRLSADASFAAGVTSWRVAPAREARTAPFPEGVNPRITAALAERGITELYTHQAGAIQSALAGANVVVVTGTASGKTLCYNLPVLQSIVEDPASRALYMFPTKALAQDQLDELHGLITAAGVDVKTFTYDGDTPRDARSAVRRAGHIVITNPDMLHTGILPHHTNWTRLFENLRYIVIDELHTYRGVFGSHLANVLRRLRRICEFYGSDPTFICCSATIANPRDLATRITGEEFTVIDDDGSPQGERHFIFYNPGVVNAELGIRRSAIDETANLASLFLGNDIQTIAFARSRVNTEILLSKLQADPALRGRKISGYRGGYLPSERRAIEEGLRSGDVRGVIATNALELGIDIGQLEAVLLCGYPGTISSTWQRFGRAGRRQDASVAIMIAGSSPLDQYIINHPDYFFDAPVEAGLVNPDNLYILNSHLKCAAFELPFEEGEVFGVGTTEAMLEHLATEGVLHKAGDTWHWSVADDFPAQHVSLRTGALDNVVIIDTTNKPRVLGQVDTFAAPMLVHTDAIYLHAGRQYHVDRLDWDEKKAYVKQVAVEHYTDASKNVRVAVLDDFETDSVGGLGRGWGEVRITSLPTLFKKIKLSNSDNVGWGKIDLPQQETHTTAYWLTLPTDLETRLGREPLESALLGAAHVLHQIAPLFLMCDPRDLGRVTEIKSPFTDAPTIFLYDGFPGGVGFSERLYRVHADLISQSEELVRACPCNEGCPSCVGPPSLLGTSAKDHVLELLRLGARRLETAS
jgi:DEAD/DEAH box helicase domain-containing protein